MAGDVGNARIFDSFDAFSAPKGTAFPTDPTTPFGAAFLAVGLGGEDGITESRDQTVDNKFDWNGNLVRSVRGTIAVTFSFTVLEDNRVVWGLLNPGSTAATTAATTTAPAYVTRTFKKPVGDVRAWAFETKDGALVTARILCPLAEITEVGDKQRVNSELMSQDVTVSVYPASDGVIYREITNAAGALV